MGLWGAWGCGKVSCSVSTGQSRTEGAGRWVLGCRDAFQPFLAVAVSLAVRQQQPWPRWDTRDPGTQPGLQADVPHPGRQPWLCPDGPGGGQLPSPYPGLPHLTPGGLSSLCSFPWGLVPCPSGGRGAQSFSGAGRVARGDNAARVASPAPGSPPVPWCPALWHQSPRSQSFLPSPFRPVLFLAPGCFLPLGVFSGQGERLPLPATPPPPSPACPRGGIRPNAELGRGAARGGQGCWGRLGGGGWISDVKLSQRRLLKAAEKEGWVGTAQGPGGCP